MCGIAGFTPGFSESVPADIAVQRMVAAIRHRGPDALTHTLIDGVALGHARLAIVDLEGGAQPMTDRDTGVTVVFNGEVFNHIELRERLRPHYAFRTRSDTEVILAAYSVGGIDSVAEFNGQFAFALYDPRSRDLFLVRDRFGERPIYYAIGRSGLGFASEAKALFAAGVVDAQLDSVSLWQTLHLWAPTDTRSMFRGIHAIPPATIARVSSDGELTMRRYWHFDLSDDAIDTSMTEERALDELGELLDDAVRLRLRADVPVAAYASGGLDSSLLCALAQRRLNGRLHTFSVGFSHATYDERSYQDEVAADLKTVHESVLVDDAEIGRLLPQVIRHSESVILRAAPAPMMKLSGLVRSHGIKVVLTGEGADELLGGYDLFKEAKVRQFWSRRPDSTVRPALFARLYPYLSISRQSPELLRRFFGMGLDVPTRLDFSHQIRWSNSGRIARFLSPHFLDAVSEHDPALSLLESIPAEVSRWRPLARAQYLEVRTLLSQYLLSSQGDRMLMANGVEGRFPFLDHRIAEFSSRLPDWLKIRGLNEKYLLKRYARALVPPRVVARPKHPYRAPIAGALANRSLEWAELPTSDAVESVGVFNGIKVERLVNKIARSETPASEGDSMALMAIASTQLLAHVFVDASAAPTAASAS
jgi:asparagine synthase (glutamine-hydrolysing)